jgi:histidinol-phosphatase (PHP family)
MKRIDYHIHTYLCKHAVGELDQYVEQAIKIGLDEIGFADHNPLPGGFDKAHRMDFSQLDLYYNLVMEAQKNHPGINIKFGLEADYLPGSEEFLRNQINKYPFDYVYGSIHYLDDWNFDNPVFVHKWDNCDVDEIYARYFDTLIQLIKLRVVDIIAHPDLVKKFGYRPKRLDLDAIYLDVCRSLRASDMCLEINTSGLRKEVAEIYPTRRFLEIACQNSVPVVIGSDAHTPSDTGADYDRAIDLARSVGYTHVQQFSKRKKVSVAISGLKD